MLVGNTYDFGWWCGVVAASMRPRTVLRAQEDICLMK